MADPLQELFEHGGGQGDYGKALQRLTVVTAVRWVDAPAARLPDPTVAGRAAPTGRRELDQAAALLLEARDHIVARFGVTPWQAFLTLVENSQQRRVPLDHLTSGFLRAVDA